ncbi:MAG: helix-turn-helix domain-containing protein [Kiloniellales bacterium]|jgi:AraC family carnitine catabolism transcriptional activator|nr:helix-turn-helix domain-containing protein [Kiloniellales bacterium]
MVDQPSGPRDGFQLSSFNFILQPEFPMNAFILASEALRIANQNSARDLFRWRLASETGAPVRASNGMWMSVDCDLAAMPLADAYLLFEGNLPTQRNSPELLARLRAAARYGALVGAVDTGAFALAQAGLVGGGPAVLHWEAIPTFKERFPDSEVRNQLYLVEGNRIHCAGGVATLDLMLDLIGRAQGSALANEVANALVHAPRPAEAPQRLDEPAGPKTVSLPERIIALMERNLDFPLTLEEMAADLGLSARSLARACRRHFDESPMRLYLRVRLQAARNFLFYEEFSIKDVALACGFSYPTVFARAFKRQFGETPRAFRMNWRRRQSQTYLPEIRRLSLSAREFAGPK